MLKILIQVEGHKGSRVHETNSSQFGGELQQEGAKRRKEVAYHLSCARQVASMKKETLRSCSVMGVTRHAKERARDSPAASARVVK